MSRSREYTINPVIMPEESFGVCKNYKKCRAYNVWLAWEMCVECYDQRVTKYANKNIDVIRKGMPEERLT